MKIIRRCARVLAKIVSCLSNKPVYFVPRMCCHANRKVSQVQQQVTPPVLDCTKEHYSTNLWALTCSRCCFQFGRERYIPKCPQHKTRTPRCRRYCCVHSCSSWRRAAGWLIAWAFHPAVDQLAHVASIPSDLNVDHYTQRIS